MIRPYEAFQDGQTTGPLREGSSEKTVTDDELSNQQPGIGQNDQCEQNEGEDGERRALHSTHRLPGFLGHLLN